MAGQQEAGKSDALVIEALRRWKSLTTGLIIRKTFPQLRELIDKTMRYYKPVFPKARYEQQHTLLDLPQRGKDLFWQPEPRPGQVQLSGPGIRLYRFDELTISPGKSTATC